MPITFGILTISDTCSMDASKDKSGPELERLITSSNHSIGLNCQGSVVLKKIIPDDFFQIKSTLLEWSTIENVNVILTTGGTGFSKRDVTREASRRVIEREAPGLSIAMMVGSLKITPMAMLSRADCGIRDKTLIINLPGSMKAATECLGVIAPVLPHAVDLIVGNTKEISDTHSKMQHTNCQHTCSHYKSSDGVNNSFNLGGVAGRPRESPYPMISMDEAARIIYNEVKPMNGWETLDLGNCHGRILDEDTYSLCDLPPFRASIKDGYAVIASDSTKIKRVLGGFEAGQTPGSIRLTEGCCVRVNTGAAVPNEATAVVQVEDTRLINKDDDDEEKEIEIILQPTEGQDIRPIGSDIKKNERILLRRTKIGAAEVGVLAASGYSGVRVTRIPKIGVLSTGSELQQAGEPPKSGHVYDSNKITLITLLKEYGYNALDFGIAVDVESEMIVAIKKVFNDVDVLITTGSVSMGDRDMLKPILTQVFNATIHFGRVNMKPGKPTTFATCQYNGNTKYIMCLPGNPVSATVTAHLFAIPLLRRLCKDHSRPTLVKARLTSAYKLDPRPEYARAILQWTSDNDIPTAISTGNQISSRLLSCKNANALLMLPGRSSERQEMKKDDIVPAMLLGFNDIEI